jgi:hypothetical protein
MIPPWRRIVMLSPFLTGGAFSVIYRITMASFALASRADRPFRRLRGVAAAPDWYPHRRGGLLDLPHCGASVSTHVVRTGCLALRQQIDRACGTLIAAFGTSLILWQGQILKRKRGRIGDCALATGQPR